MPGHFTHIYTARRVSDLLASGNFKDWPRRTDEHTNAAGHYDPTFCGQIMQKWEKFTAIGAVGPDLFFFSQDYNKKEIVPYCDSIMLALATYYYLDAAYENDYEPLLIILEKVNSESAAIIRVLIKLNKIWQSFVDKWNETIGPLVDATLQLADDVTGGLLSQAQILIEQIKNEFILVAEEEALTYYDIFNLFDTCITKGWPEELFLWSDMTHYRKPSAMCQALIEQAEELRTGEDGEIRFQQFLAYSLGYMTHVGTDVIAHSFVNEQCGGSFRNHPQRHHLIENHIDSWNYKNSAEGGLIPNDPIGSTKDYPDLSMSAMWFAVQLTPDNPHGEQRPSPLSEDSKTRQEQLDVDGEMPFWMAEAIVKAMIKAYSNHPHPKIYAGDTFQQSINASMLADAIQKVTGADLNQPFEELLNGIAPPASFSIPVGFPLPWEIQTMYRLMISFYKFSYNGTWELQKPRQPDFIITPPASDFTNLFQPPDFSGFESGNPTEDVCGIFISLSEWLIKELGAAEKLAGDLIRMGISPFTYVGRMALYELAMMVWDAVMKTHDVMAHTGFFIPHSEQRYENGELRLPNEIDLPLITLGGSVDGAFREALAAAYDPYGYLTLDRDQNAIGIGHSVHDSEYPYYSVFRFSRDDSGKIILDPWEYHRPWAYPDKSLFDTSGGTFYFQTRCETYDPHKSDPHAPAGAFKPLCAGPYPAGTTPDQVFFRTNSPVDPDVRSTYEHAQTPAETDKLNEIYINHPNGKSFSPLGDPVPFSAYLIGKFANHIEYGTQFNLDSDRGFGYLTWDWIRSETIQDDDDAIFPYRGPIVPPEGGGEWDFGVTPLQLKYIDTVAPLSSPAHNHDED